MGKDTNGFSGIWFARFFPEEVSLGFKSVEAPSLLGVCFEGAEPTWTVVVLPSDSCVSVPVRDLFKEAAALEAVDGALVMSVMALAGALGLGALVLGALVMPMVAEVLKEDIS